MKSREEQCPVKWYDAEGTINPNSKKIRVGKWTAEKQAKKLIWVVILHEK